MSTLVTDLGAVSSELKAVNGKLDSIMGLVLDMARGLNQAVRSNPIPQPQDNVPGDDADADAGGGGDGGGAGVGDSGRSDKKDFSAGAPEAIARAGYGQWLAGGESGGGGGIHRDHDPYVYGAPAGYYGTPRFPPDHRQHGCQGHLRYPVPPNQVNEWMRYSHG